MKRVGLIISFVLFIAAGSPVAGPNGLTGCSQQIIRSGAILQGPGGRPGGRRGRDPHGIGRLEKFRIAKLMQLLELTDEQKEQIIPMFRKMRRNLRVLHSEKREHVVALTKGIRYETISDEEIDEHIAGMEKLNHEIPRAMEKFIREMRSILSVKQVGRLVLFTEKFDLLLLDRVRGFHERGGTPEENGH